MALPGTARCFFLTITTIIVGIRRNCSPENFHILDFHKEEKNMTVIVLFDSNSSVVYSQILNSLQLFASRWHVFACLLSYVANRGFFHPYPSSMFQSLQTHRASESSFRFRKNFLFQGQRGSASERREPSSAFAVGCGQLFVS